MESVCSCVAVWRNCRVSLQSACDSLSMTFELLRMHVARFKRCSVLCFPCIETLFVPSRLDVAGQEGWQAIAKSKHVIQPLRAAVALPFLGLIVITRILKPLQGRVLAALPMRYYRELPEIPIAVYIGFVVLSVILHRYATTA